jgi:hypothetical protein
MRGVDAQFRLSQRGLEKEHREGDKNDSFSHGSEYSAIPPGFASAERPCRIILAGCHIAMSFGFEAAQFNLQFPM